VRSQPSVRLLAYQSLMHQTQIDWGLKDRGRKLDGIYFLAFHV
jgi:hypothetical protein